MRAKWEYHSASWESTYRKRYGDRVKSFPSPPGVHADDVSIFCGNVGTSTTDTIEDCSIWGYWARYGQYVFYLDILSARKDQEQFMEASKQFDAFISNVLLAD